MMGAKQSANATPRTVTIDNDGPAGVIDVSDAVVQRLTSGLKGQHSVASERDTGRTDQSIAVLNPAGTAPVSTAAITANNNAPSKTFGTISSIDARRQTDQELRNNDLYWARRVAHIEKTMQSMNEAMEVEYNELVDKVQRQFLKVPETHQLAPCQNHRAMVVNCYRLNSKETLHCGEAVRSFSDCLLAHHKTVVNN